MVSGLVWLGLCVAVCGPPHVAHGQVGGRCSTSDGYLGRCVPYGTCRRANIAPCGDGRVCCEQVTISYGSIASPLFGGDDSSTFLSFAPDGGATLQPPRGHLGRPAGGVVTRGRSGGRPLVFPDVPTIGRSTATFGPPAQGARSGQVAPRRASLLNPPFECAAPGGGSSRRRRAADGATSGRPPYGKREWVCGVTLISARYLLTAAHCVGPVPLTVVRLASTDLGSADGAEYRVERVTRHPDYLPGVVYHDLALVRLATAVPLGGHVRPFCLAAPGDDRAGRTALVSGFGVTEYGGNRSDVLLEASVPIVSAADCGATYRAVVGRSFRLPRGITAGLLCAGGGAQDACRGDSGGPLTVRTAAGATRLAGVVAAGLGCASAGVPGLYTRVSHYIDWIDSVVYG